MYGFLNPGRHSQEYRRVYSRCCQHQRAGSGLMSLPFLNYESIFLYCFWLDAKGYSALDLPMQTCCNLRPLVRDSSLLDAEVGSFSAAVGMLLAWSKIEDDTRDGLSLRMRFAKWLLAQQAQASRDYFTKLDVDFNRKIAGLIESHLAMEAVGQPVPLNHYVQPTAAAFGYVFSLLSRLSGLEPHEENLRKVGTHIGSALIAFDCAADFEEDCQSQSFNPLSDGSAIEPAMAYAERELSEAIAVCESLFGASSGTAQLLMKVQYSVNYIKTTSCMASTKTFMSPLQGSIKLGLASLAMALNAGSAPAQDSGDSKEQGDGCCCAIVCLLMVALGSKTVYDVKGTVERRTTCC